MGLKQSIKDLFEKRSQISVAPTDSFGLPYAFSTSPVSLQTAMQLSAVYRSVEVVSDSIATETWDIMEYSSTSGWSANPQNQFNYLLNYELSPAMDKYMFLKTLVAKMLLEGNGYAIIRRDRNGDPYRLDLVIGNTIMFRRPDGTIYYEVQYVGYEVSTGQQKGLTEVVDAQDMIHIKNFSYDGLYGVSTLRHAANAMGLSTAAEATAKNFFINGANATGIIKGGAANMKKEQSDKIKESWTTAITGSQGGVVVIPMGMDFQPLTVNPNDAQLLETRQFNILDICRFFGVPPMKVFDNAQMTYSNVEAYQLGFITDTITPLNSRIESEFNRKLFRKSIRQNTVLKLNVEALMQANLAAKADYVSKMFQCGGFTVNEVRERAGTPKQQNCDIPMVQVNMQKVTSKPVEKISETISNKTATVNGK